MAINFEKSSMSLEEIFKYIGFLIDMPRKRFQILASKAQKMLKNIMDLLSTCHDENKNLEVTLLNKVAGKAQFYAIAIPNGNIHFRELLKFS